MIAQITPTVLIWSCAFSFWAGAILATIWNLRWARREIAKFSAPKQPDAEGSSTHKP